MEGLGQNSLDHALEDPFLLLALPLEDGVDPLRNDREEVADDDRQHHDQEHVKHGISCDEPVRA